MSSKFFKISLCAATAFVVAGGAIILAQPTRERLLTLSADKGTGVCLHQVSASDAVQPVLATAKELPAVDPFTIREDFSKFDKGTETEPDSEVLASSYFKGGKTMDIDDAIMQSPGWSGSDCYMAAGTCALIAPYFTQDAFINTPLGNYSGHVRVKCRMKAICAIEDDEFSSEHDASVLINVVERGVNRPRSAEVTDLEVISKAGRNADTYVQLTLDREEGWKDVEFTFNNNSSRPDGYIQFAASGGIVIDDIEIDVDGSYLPAPTSSGITDFTLDGFNLNWYPVRSVSEYEVNVKEYKYNDGDDILRDSDFENGEKPDWLIVPENAVPYEVSEGVGTDGSKGVKMYSGTTVQLRSDNSFIKDAKLWFSGENVADYEDADDASLIIEAFDGCQWEELLMFEGYDLGWADNIDFKEWFPAYTGGFAGKYYSLRIRTEGLPEGAYVALDNMSFNMGAGGTVSEKVENAECRGNSYRVENTDASCDYYYTITAVKGDERHTSRLSALEGVPAPVAYEATDVNRRGSYVASWSECPRATNYEVHNFGVIEPESDNEAYEIIDENFDGCKQGTVAEPTPLYNDRCNLNEYTLMPGWEGENNICAEGMIGCSGADESDESMLYSYLMTPYLNLNHADSYELSIKAYGQPGDRLVLSTSEGKTFYVDFQTDSDGTTGIIDNDFIVPDAQFLSYITLMSSNAQSFLLDRFTIHQSVKAFDTILTWLGSAYYDNTVTSHKFMDFKQYQFNTYGYGVYAINSANSRNILRSDMSNLVRVPFTDDVENIQTSGRAIEAIYSVDGMRLQSLQPGVNIVRYTDGTCRKVMVK